MIRKECEGTVHGVIKELFRHFSERSKKDHETLS
jgi:hypothetical protein